MSIETLLHFDGRDVETLDKAELITCLKRLHEANQRLEAEINARRMSVVLGLRPIQQQGNGKSYV